MSNGSGLMSNEGPVRAALVLAGKGGVAGEVGDLRRDVAATLTSLIAQTVDEFSNVPAADTDAIKTTFQSVNGAAVEYTGAALDGVVGVAEMDPPRNITITTGAGGTPAESPSEAYITGVGADGVTRTETLALSQAAGTDVGVYAFKRITKVALKNDGTGTGAALTVGFGTLMGFNKKLKDRAGVVMVTLEVEAGSAAVAGALAGTYVAAVVGLPYGTVDPSAAPNGTNDYAYVYEYDPTA